MTGIVGFLYSPLHFLLAWGGLFFSLFTLQLLSFLLEEGKRHPISIVHAFFFSFLFFFVLCGATPIMEHTPIFVNERHALALACLGKTREPNRWYTSPRTQISIHRRECLLFISHAPPRGHYLCNPPSWLREPPPKV